MEVPQIDIRETGKNIRRMRTERGIRVTEISDALMIDKQAVYRWEYGKSLPQLENCLALARMFHTTIEDIFHIERGYADMEGKLRALGTCIEKKPISPVTKQSEPIIQEVQPEKPHQDAV